MTAQEYSRRGVGVRTTHDATIGAGDGGDVLVVTVIFIK